MNLKHFFDDVKAILEHLSSGENSADQRNTLFPAVVSQCPDGIDPVELSNDLRPDNVPTHHLHYGIISGYLQCLLEELEKTMLFVSSEKIGIIESNPLIILHTMSQDDISIFCKKALELVDEHMRCLIDDWRVTFENDIAILSIALDPILVRSLSAFCHLQDVTHTIDEHITIATVDEKTGKSIAKIAFHHAEVLLQAFAVKITYDEKHFASQVEKLCKIHVELEETKKLATIVSNLLAQHKEEGITSEKLADCLVNIGSNKKPESDKNEIVTDFKKKLASTSLCLLRSQLTTKKAEKALCQSSEAIANIENPYIQSNSEIFKNIDTLVSELLNPTLSILSYIEPLGSRYTENVQTFILNKTTRFWPLCEGIDALICECEEVFSQDSQKDIARDVAIKIQTEILSKVQEINMLSGQKLPSKEAFNILVILSTLGYTITPHLPEKHQATAIQILCNLHTTICHYALNFGALKDAKEHVELHSSSLALPHDLDPVIVNSLKIRMLFMEAKICLIENKPADAKQKIEALFKRISPSPNLNNSALVFAENVKSWIAIAPSAKEALLQAAIIHYRKGETKDAFSTLEDILKRCTIQDVIVSIVTKSYLNDLEALPHKKSRSPEIIYCQHNQLNKARFKLLAIKTSISFKKIDDHISQLFDLKSNSHDPDFIAEALKLIVIACCDKALHYRMDAWKVADGFLQEAKEHLDTAKAEVDSKLKKTLIPFLESHINDTEYLVQHSMSTADLVEYRIQLDAFVKEENLEQLLLFRKKIDQRMIYTVDSVQKNRVLFLFEISEIIFNIRIRKFLSWDAELTVDAAFFELVQIESASIHKLSDTYQIPLKPLTNCFIELVNLSCTLQDIDNKSIKEALQEVGGSFLKLNNSVLYAQYHLIALSIQYNRKCANYSTLLTTIRDLCASVAIVTVDKCATDRVKAQMTLFFRDKLLSSLTQDLAQDGCSIKKISQIIAVMIEAIKTHGSEQDHQTLSDFQHIHAICQKILAEKKAILQKRKQSHKKKRTYPVALSLQTYRLLNQIKNANSIYRLILLTSQKNTKIVISQCALDQLIELQQQHPENSHLNFILGHIYYYQKNPDAKVFLENASELNHPDAKFLLGKMYCEGKYGCESDFKTSLGFFKQSAKRQHVDAALHVANCYQYGLQGKLDPNEKKAEKYARFAFNACMNDPEKKTEIKEKFGLKSPPKKATSRRR